MEAAELQADNPACRLSLVSTTPGDADSVFLTEVWASEEDWEHARESPEVQQWAGDMPELVDGPPETTPLDPAALR